MINSRFSLVGLAIAAVGALAIGGVSAFADTSASNMPAPSATPVLVTIKDFAFSPKMVSIPVGGSVTFKNLDQASHTATDKNGAFDSGNLDTGKSFTYTFTKAGAYHYVCTYHPSMVATIIVGATGSPSPTPDAGSGY